jgi:hypothetical protein
LPAGGGGGRAGGGRRWGRVSLVLEALELVEGAVKRALNSALMAGEGGEREGVRQLAAQAIGQALGLGEVAVAVLDIRLVIEDFEIAEAALEVAGALEAPGVDDELAEDELLERAGGREVAEEGFGEVLELCFVLAEEDEVGGREAVFEGVEADGGLAGGRAGPGAFAGIAPIGGDLTCSCHKNRWRSGLGLRVFSLNLW